MLTASNCVFKGFDVVGVRVIIQTNHTQSECFRIAGGNHNRFEQLRMHDGMGIGWYLTAGASNLVLNCDAYNNRGLDSGSLGNIDGFYANHHLGGDSWLNNTAYRNGVNYNLLCNLDNSSTTNDVPGFNHLMKNNLGYKGGTEVSNLGTTNDVTFNYFTLPVTVATNDFLSLDETLLMLPRATNGDSILTNGISPAVPRGLLPPRPSLAIPLPLLQALPLRG